MKIDLLSIILYDHLPIGNGQVHGHTLRPYCKPVSCFSEIERSQKNTVKNEKLAFSSGSHSLALSSRSLRSGACREYWNIAYRWPRAVHAHATQHHTNVLIAQPSNTAITTVRRTLLFDAPALVELFDALVFVELSPSSHLSIRLPRLPLPLPPSPLPSNW
jgi:hypothetical protein